MINLQIILLDKYTDKSILVKNKLAHIIALNLVNHEDMPEQYKTLIDDEKELIDKEIAELSNRPKLMRLLADYFRIHAFLNSIFLNNERSKKNLQKAIQYDNSATALTHNEFAKLFKSTKKECKLVRKEYKTLLKEFLSEEKYKLLTRVEILPSHITFIASTTATIFLLSGYLYNKYYLGAFGIEVSTFFSLSDYLASSIDKLYIAGLSTVFTTVFYVLGLYEGLQIEVERVHFESESKFPIRLFYLGWLNLFILTAVGYYIDFPLKYMTLAMLGYLTFMFLFHKIPIYRYVKNSNSISILAVSFVFFVASLFHAISTDIDRVNRYSVAKIKKFDFEFNNSVPLNPSTSVILAGTGDNVFFYDKESKSTYVIPRSNIKWVKPVEPRPSLEPSNGER